MAHLDIIAPGMMTSVQDLGRFGHQAQGVPVSGAVDPMAMRSANALVGNSQDMGALEIRLLGPTIRIEADSVRIALVGTETSIEILEAEPGFIPSNRSVTLTRGQVFRVGAISDSAVCYLAIEGGFDLPLVYNSQSTYILGHFGGYKGRTLKAGDQVPLTRPSASPKAEKLLPNPVRYDAEKPIRVILGPQADYFTDEGIKTFLARDYQVTPEANRMGMRLQGPEIEHSGDFNINSDGIVTGSIQVPGNGLPIILLADHQTTGGYPKIATVASVDIPRLGRLAPGATLRFAAISVEEAEEARRKAENALQNALDALESLPEGGSLLDYILANRNLISGVEG